MPTSLLLVLAFTQVAAAPVATPRPSIDCGSIVVAESIDSAGAHFKAGQAAILATKWAQAEVSLLRAVAFNPLLSLGHYGLGQTYMAQGRFQDAVSAFTNARDAYRCFPITPEARKQRTREIQELRDAIRNLDQRRLKEIGARWREANGDLATAGSQMKTSQDAERRLLEMEASLKDVDPSPPGVTLALGTALFQTGAIADAEAAFRAVLVRDPQSGDAHHNLALVCAITDRLEEAEREVTAAEKAGVPVNPRLRQEIERRKALKPR